MPNEILEPIFTAGNAGRPWDFSIGQSKFSQEYFVYFKKIKEPLNQSARAIREKFFATARQDFAGIICLFQEITTKLWRKRPAKRRRIYSEVP